MAAGTVGGVGIGFIILVCVLAVAIVACGFGQFTKSPGTVCLAATGAFVLTLLVLVGLPREEQFEEDDSKKVGGLTFDPPGEDIEVVRLSAALSFLVLGGIVGIGAYVADNIATKHYPRRILSVPWIT